jgi:hypothetical protein
MSAGPGPIDQASEESTEGGTVVKMPMDLSLKPEFCAVFGVFEADYDRAVLWED